MERLNEIANLLAGLRGKQKTEDKEYALMKALELVSDMQLRLLDKEMKTTIWHGVKVSDIEVKYTIKEVDHKKAPKYTFSARIQTGHGCEHFDQYEYWSGKEAMVAAKKWVLEYLD